MTKVTVFSKANCQPCKATIRKLAKHSIPYNVIDITHDEARTEALIAEGFKESPIVKLETGESWSGYRPDLIEALVPGGVR